MKLNLISLDTVKTQLGIATATTTYDTDITAMIPIVSADVRRIINNRFNETHPAEIVSGSNILNVYNTAKGYNQWPYYNDIALPMGQVICSDALPDDTYIIEEDYDTGEYTLSSIATDSSDHINPTINISQWPTISGMIYYRILSANISEVDKETFVSRTLGPLSLNLGAGNVNKRWNYPQKLIDDLGIPFVEVG